MGKTKPGIHAAMSIEALRAPEREPKTELKTEPKAEHAKW